MGSSRAGHYRASNGVDEWITGFDRGLRTLTGTHQAARPNPAKDVAEADLTAQERSHVAGLMRVNHTGEVCAQALYEGQALMASDTNAKASLMSAAAEEQDHLVWCRSRLRELDARPSDSIVLALQMKKPIHVASRVLENVEDMSEILERILRKQD